MRATILFLVLTVLVSVSGVWWVNSRSPVEAVPEPATSTSSESMVQSAPVDEVDAKVEREIARLEALGAYDGRPASNSLGRDQSGAELAQLPYGLKGCYESGKTCRCIGADNRLAAVSKEACRQIASGQAVPH